MALYCNPYFQIKPTIIKMNVLDWAESFANEDYSKYSNQDSEEGRPKDTYVQSLRRHGSSICEGVKYPCKHCDYIASTSSNLHRHVKSVHEGVKYPCKQCDYTTSHPTNLNTHIKI